VSYCQDCGNCDCPNVTADAYWNRCPASDRKSASHDEAQFLVAMARKCRNGCGVSCGNRPCDACCAGGICDAVACKCDDDVDYADGCEDS
jgi:hypothetical protein